MPDLILDAGQKIGGARKDLTAALRARNLDVLTDAEKAELVTKDAAWPKPDWEALVNQGMEPRCAALLKIVRDRVAARPVIGRGEFKDACRIYMDAMRILSEEAARCQTTQDAMGLYRSFEVRLNTEMGPVISRASYLTITNGRSIATYIRAADIQRAAAMVVEGFPGNVPAWRKGVRAVLFREGGWRMKDRKGWLDIPAQPTEAEGWERVKERYERLRDNAKTARDGNAPLPTRPHLRKVVRNGMEVRDGVYVGAEDFLDAFGFRGVEFGEWLPQDERQAVLDHAWDALHDLTLATGLEPRQLSLGGSLALAFGARGQGGAAAHYEPGRTVVNLTRMSGAGSLAHEWAHALDHWLGLQGGPAMEGGNPRFASGYRTPRSGRAAVLKELPDGLAHIIDTLVEGMYRRKLSIDEVLTPVLKSKTEARQVLATLDPYSAAATSARARINTLERRENVIRTAPRSYLPTSFHQQSVNLSGVGGYHARPTEMWARSFECMVSDALHAANMRSDYLVQGVEADRFAGGAWKGNPYPVGEERERLNALHVNVLAHAKALIPVMDKDVVPGF